VKRNYKFYLVPFEGKSQEKLNQIRGDGV